MLLGITGVLVLSGCNAIVGNEPIEYRTALGRQDAGDEDAESDASCSAEGQIQRLEGDGGTGATVVGQCGYLAIDDVPFPVTRIGLDLGLPTDDESLSGSGWSTLAEADGTYLHVGGVDDATYPQTKATTFRGAPTLQIFDQTDSWYTNLPGGSAEIVEGPELRDASRHVKKVRGSGTLVGQSSGRIRRVEFEFEF